ncbi:hypothetical protein CEXT_449741 [Caerostris extrusa]|uniref:Uncharacterized protein n=1 Tax=Caerostris extrusa TaxID=172846 RepID=A0AAV4U8D5_CAEEX|nr:hypothetical protein CEXT_449741 [Caerostris extrusa]
MAPPNFLQNPGNLSLFIRDWQGREMPPESGHRGIRSVSRQNSKHLRFKLSLHARVGARSETTARDACDGVCNKYVTRHSEKNFSKLCSSSLFSSFWSTCR